MRRRNVEAQRHRRGNQSRLLQNGGKANRGNADMTSKVVYAQSSDIKSRTYLEYRRDMKKKAIAELEFMPFLANVLSAKNGAKTSVQKHGGDAELWFAPSGRLTGAPDYEAKRAGDSFLYEFQYAERTDGLTHFDFKVSKVGKKTGGRRIPHSDREFFYVVKPENKYAFVSPEWIMQNGREGAVPAWGSRIAYRVKADVFRALLQDGGAKMAKVVAAVDDKNVLLEFQHQFLDMESARLSRRLQRVVDEKETVKIVPGDLRGFYEVCHILDKLGKPPDNPGVWLVYLISFFRPQMSAADLAQFMFALDYLYFQCAEIKDNEKRALAEVARNLADCIGEYSFADGLYARDSRQSPMEETRRILFAVNLLEDLTQDIAVNWDESLNKAKKIFQLVPNAAKTAARIRSCASD